MSCLQNAYRGAMTTRDEPSESVAVSQPHEVCSISADLDYSALNFEGINSGHVMISGSPSVISTVCSK